MIDGKRNFKMLRIVCFGKIKCCDRCSDIDFSEGYCPQCGRPLWRKPEETCNSIVGYVENGIKKQGKVNFICRNCSTVTTF